MQKASPSKGLIRNDFSPEAIADIYGHYATAISVLTDEVLPGDFAFLPGTGRVQQPVLCKDFMIDPIRSIWSPLSGGRHPPDASVLTDEG